MGETMKRITTKDAAQRLNVTRGRIQQLIQEGRLQATKWGRDWIVDEDSIVQYCRTKRQYNKHSVDKPQEPEASTENGEKIWTSQNADGCT